MGFWGWGWGWLILSQVRMEHPWPVCSVRDTGGRGEGEGVGRGLGWEVPVSQFLCMVSRIQSMYRHTLV